MLFSFLKAKNNARKINSGTNSDNLAGVRNTLQFLDDESLYPDFHLIEDKVNEPVVIIGGDKYLMFCSNNYLSITQNRRVKDAAVRAANRYGVGPGGSRVISGNTGIVVKLENKMAELTGCEDCLTFPTGYMANVSVFQALMDPLFFNLPSKSSESVIYSDEKNHGSIVDGIRLSKARRVIFKHNDIDDLRTKILENNLPNKLIVTEGVFSLEGEIVDPRPYISVAKEFGAKLMVDDAHGIGILGENGGGTPEHFGASGEVDILMGSFDKAFGSMGGYICGKKDLIKYLRVACRSSILSSSFPTMLAGALVEAIDVVRESRLARKDVFDKANKLKRELNELGFKVMGSDTLPAVAVYIGNDIKGINFSKELFKRRVICPVFRWPATGQNECRLRLTVMSDHTEHDIEQLIRACKEVGQQLGVI